MIKFVRGNIHVNGPGFRLQSSLITHNSSDAKNILLALSAFSSPEYNAELIRVAYISIVVYILVYNRNYYFGLGLIPKPKLKLADTFG